MAVNVTRATHVCRFVRTWRCDGGCYEGECREQRPQPRAERDKGAGERPASQDGEVGRQT
jgi:hypothetical protein